MVRRCLLPVLVCCFVLAPRGAGADGSIPPLPYRYLHPPPALASGNRHPAGVSRTVSVASGNLSVFTPDGQAGISPEVQTLGNAQRLAVRISPVNTPSGLPSDLAADGNAYALVVQTLSNGKQSGLVSGLAILTLRFPHIPTGIYHFSGGHWSRVCANTGGAIISSATITCRVQPEGVYIAVTTPQNAGVSPPPATPIPGLGPYIPIIAAGLLILATLALAYVTARRRRVEGPPV